MLPRRELPSSFRLRPDALPASASGPGQRLPCHLWLLYLFCRRRGRNLSRLPRLHLLPLQDDDATSHGSVLVASVLRWLQAGDIHGAAAGGAHTTMNVRRCGLVATYFPLTPH